MLLYLPFLLLITVFAESQIFMNDGKICYNDGNSNLFCNENSNHQQSFGQLTVQLDSIESSDNNETITITCPHFYTDGNKNNYCFMNPIYDPDKNTCSYLPINITTSNNPCKIGTCNPNTGEIVYEDNPIYCFVPENREDTVTVIVTETIDISTEDEINIEVVDVEETIDVYIEFNEIEHCKNINNQCVISRYDATCIPMNNNYECMWLSGECKCIKRYIKPDSNCLSTTDLNTPYYHTYYKKEIVDGICKTTEYDINPSFNPNMCIFNAHLYNIENYHFGGYYICPFRKYCPELKSKIYQINVSDGDYDVLIDVLLSYSDIVKCMSYNKECIPTKYTTHCDSLDPKYVCEFVPNEPENPCRCKLINSTDDCPVFVDYRGQPNNCYEPLFDGNVCHYTFKESYEENGLLFACNPETGNYENRSATTTISLTPGYLVSKNKIKTRSIRNFERRAHTKGNAKRKARITTGNYKPINTGKYFMKTFIKFRGNNNSVPTNENQEEQNIFKSEMEIIDLDKNTENVVNYISNILNSTQSLVETSKKISDQIISDVKSSLKNEDEICNKLNTIKNFVVNVSYISSQELDKAKNLTKREMKKIKDQIDKLEKTVTDTFTSFKYKSELQQEALTYINKMKDLQVNVTNEVLKCQDYINISTKQLEEKISEIDNICPVKNLTEVEEFITSLEVEVKDIADKISQNLTSMENIIKKANDELSTLSKNLENLIQFLEDTKEIEAREEFETKINAREYSECKIVSLWLMYKKIGYVDDNGIIFFDNLNIDIIPSDNSLACFYYNDNYYCIEKDRIQYLKDFNGDIIAYIYSEDININDFSGQFPVTVVSIE